MKFVRWLPLVAIAALLSYDVHAQPVPGSTFTVVQGPNPWVESLNYWAGIAIGAPSAYGTSPGAVNAPGVNAFVTNTASENLAQVNGITVLTGAGATGTGSQRVTVAVDASTVAGSATLPAGTAIIGKVGIDQTTPGTTNAVVTGTYGRVDSSPTVTNAAYASGNDIGGLVTFALPATASGILQSIGIQFVGGATTAITAYCFDANPTGSTFTDKSTFTIAAADTPKMITKAGIVLTPAVSVGGTRSAAVFDNYAKPFTSGANIYCVFASGGTFTPASTTDMNVSITYYQNGK